ncbi:MAG: hypothetical protein FWC95_06960 [Defluviitaleaceae bacterium]|nr:hypothetical protein [Defluviitaleaceae bacterium]
MQVEEYQKKFLAPNYASLAEGYLKLASSCGGVPFEMFTICNENDAIGFAMIYCIYKNKKTPDDLTGYQGGDGESCYYLSRFMLDKRF